MPKIAALSALALAPGPGEPRPAPTGGAGATADSPRPGASGCGAPTERLRDPARRLHPTLAARHRATVTCPLCRAELLVAYTSRGEAFAYVVLREFHADPPPCDHRPALRPVVIPPAAEARR